MCFEDLQSASKLLRAALQKRRHYMDLASQSFPSTTSRFLDLQDDIIRSDTVELNKNDDRKTIKGWIRFIDFGVSCFFGL